MNKKFKVSVCFQSTFIFDVVVDDDVVVGAVVVGAVVVLHVAATLAPENGKQLPTSISGCLTIQWKLLAFWVSKIIKKTGCEFNDAI